MIECANIIIKCHAALANIFENTLPYKQCLKLLTWSFNRHMCCPFHLARAGTSCCGTMHPAATPRNQEQRSRASKEPIAKKVSTKLSVPDTTITQNLRCESACAWGEASEWGWGAGRGAAAGGGARGVVGLERRRQWQSFNRLFVYKSVRNTLLKNKKKQTLKDRRTSHV